MSVNTARRLSKGITRNKSVAGDSGARKKTPPTRAEHPVTESARGRGRAKGSPEQLTARPVSRASSHKTREVILDGALAEFSEKGFDGARIDEIAFRAGVNKNLLYHHYGSKDGLFTALLERTYDTIRRRQKDLQLRDMDPVEGMRKLVVFTGRVWVQFPEFLRLLQSENLSGGRHVRTSTEIPKMYNPLLDTIAELLERGAKAGVFRKNVEPIDLYISISSLTAHYITHHHTFEALFGQRLMSSQRIKQRIEHAADMVERYLLVQPKSRS